MEFSSAAGVFTGMGADIIAMIEKRLGVVFIKRPAVNWNKTLSDLESGACALAPTIVSTPERERIVFFTPPYATVPLVIIGRQFLNIGMTLGDFSGRRVAVVAGSLAERYLRSGANDRIEILPFPDHNSGCSGDVIWSGGRMG